MTCVCGHPESEHVVTAMSVELVGQNLYPPSGPLQIAITREEATYEQQLCWCGCSYVEPDGESVSFKQAT